MLGLRQVEKILYRLRDEECPSNKDIIGALEDSFIRLVERESDLKIHRLFGGYYVRRRIFASSPHTQHNRILL